jgi:predicted TIM-barrel fold metal-dependent hydrolase
LTTSDIAIIDCHTHIGRLPGVVHDLYGAEDLHYIGANEGVTAMLASSASASLVSQATGTTETIEMVRCYGETLKGVLWLNPHDPAWAQDVPRAVAHGFVGIKIHPVLDHYAVTRPALDDIFLCAQEQGWPIITHTGPDASPTSAFCYEPLVQAYPRVCLVLAHLRLEAIPLARRYDNVYVDTTHVDSKLIELALPILGSNKILFGTDAPAGFDVGHALARERPRRSYAGIIGDLRTKEIPDASLERILYENARELFDVG